MAIEIQGMAPLIQVFDMPTSLRFYRDILGFEVTNDSGRGDLSDWVMLQRGDSVLMLNTRYEADFRPAAPDPAAATAHHDTCLYLGCPNVDAAFAYLRESGLEIKPPKVAPYGMKQLYLHDPDGFGICFQWPVED